MNAAESVQGFFLWLGRTSIQASLLILLILLVQALAGKRLPPRWRHSLWFLLLARLALPWAPPSGMSVYNLFAVVRPARSVPVSPVAELSRAAIAPADFAATPSKIPPDQASLPPNSFEASASDPVASTAPPSRDKGIPYLLLAIGWAAGAIVILGAALAQSLALGRAVSGRRPVTDQSVLDLLEACKEEMGIRAWLIVVETPCVQSPALFGFIRPRLLLPEGSVAALGLPRLRHVFLHELAHLRRRDIAVNWLVTVLQALHWFNPLVWFAFHRMRADRELACDGLALSCIGPVESREYGRTIIHLLENLSACRRLPSLAGIIENRNQIKRRVTMIAEFKTTHRRLSAVSLLLMTGLGCMSLTNPKIEGNAEPGPIGASQDLSPMVGTWFFDNSIGDDEQLAIFPDGRVVALYSNGHKDEMQYQNGAIKSKEYQETFAMNALNENQLVTYRDDSGQGLAKIWRRIDRVPRVELLRPLTGGESDTNARVEEAEENLKLITDKFSAGLVTQKEMIEAQTSLKITKAEAAHDPWTAAHAKNEGAEALYALAKRNHEAGLATSEEVREAEDQFKIASQELEGLTKTERSPVNGATGGEARRISR